MKSKPSLRNSARPVLLFSLVIILFTYLYGCRSQLEPTYKEKDIPQIVKKICKDEYGLDVTTQRTNNTLWVYAPVDKILHPDYGKKEDKIFDEAMTDKLRNILMTVGRVLINSDNAPEFFVLLASDIKLGLDYTLIGNVLDIKKSYADFIHWTEANRRYVIRLNIAPQALGDLTGEHLKAVDIYMPDFLAEQIAQRIGAYFQGEGLKKYFKAEGSNGRFKDGIFTFEYAIKQIAKPNTQIDIKEEMLKIITYCIQTYEFKEFKEIQLNNLLANDKIILNRPAIWARPQE